jgi:hypothetical protein
MKRTFFLIALSFILSFPSFAQEDLTKPVEKKDTQEAEIKTLFGKKKHPKPHIGFFIGPEGAYTQFSGGEDVVLLGVNMGATIDHWFSVGLSGYGIINGGNLYYPNFIFDSINNQWKDANLYGGYGGVTLGFTILPKAPVHITFPVLIGGGGLAYVHRYEKDQNYYDWSGGESIDWDAFFVIQPGVQLEINVVKFFRIGIGASYRYTPDLDIVNTADDLINQFNANLSLKFGKF